MMGVSNLKTFFWPRYGYFHLLFTSLTHLSGPLFYPPMDLLILYFSLAIGISFLCSILESVLFSVNGSYVAVLEKRSPRAGRLLKGHKSDINKSIASILILNTIANTLGAAGVGAQAKVVYGSTAVFYVSVALTLAILFFSEIIPKTIGAVYWKQLAPIAAHIIHFFIWLTYPLILVTQFVTRHISQNYDGSDVLSKEELLHTTLQSEYGGVLDEQESDVIENVLMLDEVKVESIMTPRSVVFSLDRTMTVAQAIGQESLFNFSRIPVYSGGPDHMTGIVLTKKIFHQAIKDDSIPIGDIAKKIFMVSQNLPVSRVLDQFIKRKEHMFLVVDSYDQTAGIVTLEDCIETVLGVEIMDESDTVEDMREYAKQKMKILRRKRGS